MTEAEWLASGDVTCMVGLIYLSDRKRRLFAVECCRLIDHLFADERSRAAVAVAERYAEGQASRAELMAARDTATVVLRALEAGEADPHAWTPATFAAEAARRCAYRDAIEAAEFTAASVSQALSSDDKTARRVLADLLREIVGIPHRVQTTYGPWAEDRRHQISLRSWRSATAQSLAQTMYETRDFSALPILADALEDAGCTDRAILDHCRTPGEHVRGCWVVDLALGKE